MKIYNLSLTVDDPEIKIRIPSEILRDLVLRSEENGSSIELELAVRLARTLERNLEMIEEDNGWLHDAFDKVTSEE